MRGTRELVIAAAICLVAFLAAAAHAAPVGINVIGNWTLTVGPSDLIAGAGSNLISTYESSPSQVSVSITNATAAWGVTVKFQGPHWDNSLHLWVRRTGDGGGAGTIQSGTAYQELDNPGAAFFAGTLDRTDIPVQLMVTGVSVQLLPDTYSATVTYTVSAL